MKPTYQWFESADDAYPQRCPHCNIKIEWAYNNSSTVQFICQSCFDIRWHAATQLLKAENLS